jgi:transglutaminase-like putative cysteine protease
MNSGRKQPRFFWSSLLPLFVCLLLPVVAQETPPSTAPAPSPVGATAEMATDSASGKIVREDWMIILLQNKRCGFGSALLHERTTPLGKQYISDSHQEFKISREGLSLHQISDSSTVETEEGVVVSFQAESHGGGSDQVMRGYRIGEEMVVFSGGQKKRYPMPKKTLGPEAFDRLTRHLKMEPGTTLTASTFSTDFPELPVTSTLRVIGKEKRSLPAGERELWKVVLSMSAMPGLDIYSYLDDEGEAHQVIMPFPGLGELQVIVTTRAEAMKELESVELFTNTLITPKQPLANLRRLKSATLRLTTRDGSPIPLWSGPGQKVLESKPGQTVIEISVPQLDPKSISWQLPHASEPELEPYLKPSLYIEQTPRIRELAQKAVGEEKNPVLAARKIETFVRGYITRKDLSVGFASADETAVSRTGDCTEHAVLCAALGRAVGLPTRVVVGYGYLPTDYGNKQDNGTFGFHMWAEAWVGPDQWAPMDAALGRFDVGHIALAKSALQEINPLVELTMPILNLMQNLQIEVVSTQ